MILTIQRRLQHFNLLPFDIVKYIVFVNIYCSDTLSMSMEEREKLARIEPQTVRNYSNTHKIDKFDRNILE